MRMRPFRLLIASITASVAAVSGASAGMLTYSHGSSALPAAAGPAITLLSITGVNDGTNFNLTLTFANPTIEGPSSGNADAVYGFINLDTDHNAATGVSGAFLDSNGLEPGFGQFSSASQGIDAYINLSSEGDPLHGAAGMVDLVTTNGFTPIELIPVSYANQVGSTPSTLSLSISLSVFAANQITAPDPGDFSAIVGNLNNATDFLRASAVPEPSSWALLALGLPLGAIAIRRAVWRESSRRSAANG